MKEGGKEGTDHYRELQYGGKSYNMRKRSKCESEGGCKRGMTLQEM